MFLELPADDPMALVQFYTSLFSWTKALYPGLDSVWVLYSGPFDQPGVNAIVTLRQYLAHTRVAAFTDDLKQTTDKVVAAGGRVVIPEVFNAGIGLNSVCADPEGLEFILNQPEPGCCQVLTGLAAEGIPTGQINRFKHIDIPARDLTRTVDFYAQALDWKLNKWDMPEPYIFVKTGEKDSPGIDGGIKLRREIEYPSGTILVEDLAATLQQAVELGGSIHCPPVNLTGLGYFAFAKDPEGNAFGLFQRDPQA